MAKQFPYDVFLSHNHTDKPKVLRLAERLKAAGLKVWLDDWVVKPGDIIALKLDEGLEQSRVLLLCISPAVLASGWVALERSTAIHRDPTNEGRRFIPLLLEDCELPDTLRRYKYVDYIGEMENAFREVLASCRLETVVKQKEHQSAISKKPKVTKIEDSEPFAVLERKLEGHDDRVRRIAVSLDGTWAVSGSRDCKVKIWDLESKKCILTLKAKDDVWSVAIGANNKIAWLDDNGTLEVWNINENRKEYSVSAHYAFSFVKEWRISHIKFCTIRKMG
jgi:TIR domain/WD domain, G-beta repeat